MEADHHRPQIANAVIGILAIAFTVWAGVVAIAANVILGQLDDLQGQVEQGILPRADERITALERRLDRLERTKEGRP